MKCEICETEVNNLICPNKHCNEEYIECAICKEVIQQSKSMEYRGQLSCENCDDENVKSRERDRQEIISEQDQVDRICKPLRYIPKDNSRFANELRKEYSHLVKLAKKETFKRKRYEETNNV